MISTAARRRGKDDVLTLIADVPDSEHAEDPVNSL
jgi:hypothetical protein